MINLHKVQLLTIFVATFNPLTSFAVDWKPIPELQNWTYDADSINADSNSAAAWIRDPKQNVSHVYIDCEKRMIGTIVDRVIQNEHEFSPGSFSESFMVLCKSKWMFWK